MSLKKVDHELALQRLVGEINSAHDVCLDAAQDTLTKAIEVGRLLDKAKSQVGHGKWIPWVEAHCEFGIKQAQNYMRAFYHRDEIRSDASHFSSLHAVIKALEQSWRGKDEDEPEPEEVARAEASLHPLTEEEEPQTYREYTALVQSGRDWQGQARQKRDGIGHFVERTDHGPLRQFLWKISGEIRTLMGDMRMAREAAPFFEDQKYRDHMGKLITELEETLREFKAAITGPPKKTPPWDAQEPQLPPAGELKPLPPAR
jgi:hypothetical protein